jgi:hypothetical protein
MAMPTTKHQRDHERFLEEQVRQTLQARIEREVIHRLGAAAGPHNVQVRRLWEDHYRVNVLDGAAPTATRIANSYFVESDRNGRIVGSNPLMTALPSPC